MWVKWTILKINRYKPYVLWMKFLYRIDSWLLFDTKSGRQRRKKPKWYYSNQKVTLWIKLLLFCFVENLTSILTSQIMIKVVQLFFWTCFVTFEAGANPIKSKIVWKNKLIPKQCYTLITTSWLDLNCHDILDWFCPFMANLFL